MDDIHRQILIINRNPIYNMFDHPGKFIILYQLAEVYRNAAFKHPQTVNHVDPCQRSE